MQKSTSTRWWLLTGLCALLLLAVAISLSWTRITIDAWLIRTLLIVTSLAIAIYLIAFLSWSNTQRRELEREHVRMIQKAQDAGRAEGFATVGRSLVADRDMLSMLWHWSSDRQTQHEILNRQEWVSEEILDRLMRSARLTPIERVGTTVKFNPTQYLTSDQLKPNETALVVDPGWRIGSETLKLPVVRRCE